MSKHLVKMSEAAAMFVFADVNNSNLRSFTGLLEKYKIAQSPLSEWRREWVSNFDSNMDKVTVDHEFVDASINMYDGDQEEPLTINQILNDWKRWWIAFWTLQQLQLHPDEKPFR